MSWRDWTVTVAKRRLISLQDSGPSPSGAGLWACSRARPPRGGVGEQCQGDPADPVDPADRRTRKPHHQRTRPPPLSFHRASMAALVKVADSRWRAEETFQARRGWAGLVEPLPVRTASGRELLAGRRRHLLGQGIGTEPARTGGHLG